MAVTLCLPIADRRRSMTFYTEVFGFEAFGEPAADGVPEPVQLRLDQQTVLMLIPADGFGWVLGDRPAAPAGVSECLLSLACTDEAEVRATLERVAASGGTVLTAPQRQPWGFAALCADPDGHAWQLQATG
jgi:uncharacterized glyoxalase superfamily protein PhnB